MTSGTFQVGYSAMFTVTKRVIKSKEQEGFCTLQNSLGEQIELVHNGLMLMALFSTSWYIICLSLLLLHTPVSELQLQNRPLPPPPPSDVTSPVFSEPTYSPVLKNHKPSSPERLQDQVEDAGYAYVRVHDGTGIPEDFDYRRLPTPPTDDDSESGEAPVEDAPEEVGGSREMFPCLTVLCLMWLVYVCSFLLFVSMC